MIETPNLKTNGQNRSVLFSLVQVLACWSCTKLYYK